MSPDRDPRAPHAEPRAAGDVDLRVLVERGWLHHLPRALVERPPRIDTASADARAALGYLHGNCGHCHNDPRGSEGGVPLDLRLAQYVARPDSADAVRRSLQDAPSRFRAAGAAGAERDEALALRMRSRDPRVQMPPLGTRIADTEAIKLIERWINHDLKTRQETKP